MIAFIACVIFILSPFEHAKYVISLCFDTWFLLKELSHGSPHTHGKVDNDIHNVLCQQLARRQDHSGLYVVHTYIAQ